MPELRGLLRERDKLPRGLGARADFVKSQRRVSVSSASRPGPGLGRHKPAAHPPSQNATEKRAMRMIIHSKAFVFHPGGNRSVAGTGASQGIFNRPPDL